MKRKGVALGFFAFMTAFVVAAAAANNLFFYNYVSNLESNIESSSAQQHQRAGKMEEVLNAECVTRSRGVFTTEAVAGPDGNGNADAFTCITPPDEAFIMTFYWREQDTFYSYKIEPQNPGESSHVEVQDIGNIGNLNLDDVVDQYTTTHTYPVVIYDGETDEYHKASMTLSE